MYVLCLVLILIYKYECACVHFDVMSRLSWSLNA